MLQPDLRPIGGEFACAAQEAAFQADRLGETRRHARLLFLLSAILNFVFLASDVRFLGQPHFVVAVSARCAVVAFSLVCLALVARPRDFPGLQRLMLAYQAVTAAGVALLVTSRSDIALLVVLLLPAVFMLVVPTRFAWTLAAGLGTSAILNAAYMLPPPLPPTALGLALAAVMESAALVLVVARANRLRRLEWAATQAARGASAELERSRLLSETLFRAVPLPVIVATIPEGRFQSMNDAALRLLGLDGPEGFADMRTRDLVADEDRRRIQAAIDRDGSVRDLEFAIRTGAGARTMLLSAECVQLGGQTCLVSSLVDITDRKAAEAAIRAAAHHDVLTGLPNRALFQATLDADLAQADRAGRRLGLILLDLDDFKGVNDTCGHAAGDALLQEVARRLTAIAEPGDLVARLGGDEFVVITVCDTLPGQPFNRVHRVAEAINAALARPVAVAGRVVSARASIGIGVFPDHAGSAADLLTNTDLALYAAKAAGGGRAVLFQPGLRARVDERAALAQGVRVGLREGQVVPHYQPKVCLRTGRVLGFEALARWRHPERGLLAPGAFASVFDDAEIGAGLGTHIAERVAGDLAGWLWAGLDPGRVFVNLSSAQFAKGDVAADLLAVLEAAGVPPARFGVEVTETVLLGGQGERVGAALDRLHAAGVAVALDDFGTGYASLTHLKRFPVDEIKIDRSFIADVIDDPSDAAIVTAVAHLGHALGLTVVAEGVETPEQVAFLRVFGCGVAQGYLYARPSPAEDVPALLAAPWTEAAREAPRAAA